MKQIKNGGLWSFFGCLRYAESFSEPQSIRRRLARASHARQVAVLINKNECKKQLRRRQRQIAAEQRNGLYKEILTSHTDHKKMFYKLINKQRNHKQSSISELIIDDVHVTELDMIRKGWASYFEKLATPVDDKNLDNNYKSKVQLRKLLIQNACEHDNTDFEPI